MASGTRQPNTQEEVLRKMMGMFADLKLADDADFDWIAEQEANVIGKIRAPQDQAISNMQSQGLTAAPPQLAGGGAPGAMPMPAPGGAPGAPAGDPNLEILMQMLGGQNPAAATVPGAVPGATPPGRGPAMSPVGPNPDELRRIMTQGQ